MTLSSQAPAAHIVLLNSGRGENACVGPASLVDFTLATQSVHGPQGFVPPGQMARRGCMGSPVDHSKQGRDQISPPSSCPGVNRPSSRTSGAISISHHLFMLPFVPPRRLGETTVRSPSSFDSRFNATRNTLISFRRLSNGSSSASIRIPWTKTTKHEDTSIIVTS